MSNSTSLSQQISLFRSRIQSRSFDDVTVRILETILVSKDLQSLIGVRSALTQFMRDESLLIVREIREESVEIKLMCADFLIHVFAIIGDVEACEKALMCSKANHVANPKMDDVFNDMHAIKKIERVKDAALFTISSQSGMWIEYKSEHGLDWFA
ncbi:UNVERIFIED_CONTAM: hypothetical protein Slati_0480300 [Sesamum latifolium]|uniref:Uncharacterized protein n=1 Tax=Sesamum latifolium TaxID=2727402 RepID=A0AAW2Y0H8_9LAMI